MSSNYGIEIIFDDEDTKIQNIHYTFEEMFNIFTTKFCFKNVSKCFYLKNQCYPVIKVEYTIRRQKCLTARKLCRLVQYLVQIMHWTVTNRC